MIFKKRVSDLEKIFNRDELRRLEKAAREKDKKKLADWAAKYDDILRREYDEAFEDELADSLDNFLTAVAYTAKFSETTKLSKKKLPEFMNDLFVTVDLFANGEYLPKEYEDILLKSGISATKYHVTDRINKVATMCMKESYDNDIAVTIIDKINSLSSEFILFNTDAQYDFIKQCEKIKMSNVLYVFNECGISDRMQAEIDFAIKSRKSVIFSKEVKIENEE